MKYDVIIVGAGSAGSVLASRLSEDGSRSVLLLEAGRDYPDLGSLPDEIKFGIRPWYESRDPWANAWGYQANTNVAGREPINLPRGKVTGGSSAINGQVWFRGIPDDFDLWQESGCDGWSYFDVLPYFRKSETDLDFSGDDFHGSEGFIPVKRHKGDELLETPRAFLDACLSYGFPLTEDMNHPDSTGVGYYPLNRVDGIRMSTAMTYLANVRNNLNLTIRSEVLVHKIIVKDNTACGVLVESGGETFEVSGDLIILSGGAINSPQVLMLSGIGPSTHLDDLGIKVVHDLPGVGQNLRDHPAVFMQYESLVSMPEYTPPLQIGLRYTTSMSKFRNDMQIRPLQIRTEHVPLDFEYTHGAVPTGFSIALQKAVSKGEIRLQNIDPNTQPILDYHYLSDPYDLERMRESVRLCAQLTGGKEFAGVAKRFAPNDKELSNDDDLNHWILSNVSTQHHSSGTCKMGPKTDVMSVVDPSCNVYGLDGLMVVDASVMPDVIRANTNATTVMIAEKIADQIMKNSSQ